MAIKQVETIRQPQERQVERLDQPEERPPFNTGDRLSRAEFERRYEAYPEIKKAELIEGVVYIMPSPVRFPQHGNPHFELIGWLSVYCAATPGVLGGDNTTVQLDLENEVQPDALLRLKPELGGSTRLTEEGYLEGPPELVVEVAASSAAYDLHDKRRVYARSGVPEYLAVQMYEKRLDWFILREGVYETLAPDEKGVLRSQIFPGLWLDTAAFWQGDLAAMLATLQEGLASAEHTDFVNTIQAK
ncbi:MAG: Uma2 family endonuclease [Chloroflexi bacterium]|nr:Uma2 family endonuclease [Chloroflexota bacterium]MCI0580242.1 Uma2 family endonuclease [Chloroflexota bacterium]MCI0646897.1 Uma2 family endonuclease [Chloroflexota bacterium]MCI0729098.1 Uma2 family endonuclease [Chloroflexota bacterium]